MVMNVGSQKIKQQSAFLAFYLLFLAAGFVLFFVKGKAGSFLLLNNWHSSLADEFFIQYTNFGDGIFAVLFSLFLFFVLKKRKAGFVMLIAYASTGIVAQIIKPLVESPRPETYFFPQRFSFFIDDVIHTGHSSFPSGHTVTAFALAAVLSYYAGKNTVLQLLFLLFAISVGYSRIYLSQHFLIDVLAGSFIGVAGAVLCIYWCRNINQGQLIIKNKSGNAKQEQH
jgi:membrane-associated phospholipid phosphatase